MNTEQKLDKCEKALCIGNVSGSFTVDFIEWIGKYKMRKEKISGVEKWYSGFAYWKFDTVDEMYRFYCKNYH